MKQQRLDTPEKVAKWLSEQNNEYKNNIEEMVKSWETENGPEHWWQLRENCRQGRERLIPQWVGNFNCNDPPIRRFFVYVSALDPKKIGYTPTPEDGRRDRQVVSTVGRFLTKFYSHQFTESEIRATADKHRITYGESYVYFAFGADEIEYVYKHGPNSCMVGKEWESEPPMRIYDGPDTVLAYLKGADGNITARAVVRIDVNPMEWVRIYGDISLLQMRLNAFGFKCGDLADVRLRRAEYNDDLICPYIDGQEEARDDGEFLILGSGPLGCKYTDGVAVSDNDNEDDNEDDAVWCDGCDSEGHSADDMYGTWNDDCRCSHCIESHYVLAICDRHGREYYLPEDEAIAIGNVWYRNDDEVLEAADLRYSSVLEEWLPVNEVVYIIDDNDYHPTEDCCDAIGRDDYWLKENCRQDHDGDWVHKEDAVEVNGVYFHPDYPPDDVELVDGNWRTTEVA